MIPVFKANTTLSLLSVSSTNVKDRVESLLYLYIQKS